MHLPRTLFFSLSLFSIPFHLVLAQDTTTAAAPATTSLPPLASAAASNGAGKFGRAINNGAGGGAGAEGAKTAWAPSDDSFPANKARALALLMARQDALNSQYLYQLSPNLVDAATMRGFTGSIVSTSDTQPQDANLGGRAQSFMSHGDWDNFAVGGNSRRSLQGGSLCNNTAPSPIHLFSSIGNNVTIIEDIL
jgi:hypothetical protein